MIRSPNGGISSRIDGEASTTTVPAETRVDCGELAKQRN
jgi:hypothetical protein